MTVLLPPSTIPAWGEPGHEPWQRTPFPTTPSVWEKTRPSWGEGIPEWEKTRTNQTIEDLIQEILSIAKQRKAKRGIDPGFDPSTASNPFFEDSIKSFEDLL